MGHTKKYNNKKFGSGRFGSKSFFLELCCFPDLVWVRIGFLAVNSLKT